jgi:hypothetical protein
MSLISGLKKMHTFKFSPLRQLLSASHLILVQQRRSRASAEDSLNSSSLSTAWSSPVHRRAAGVGRTGGDAVSPSVDVRVGCAACTSFLLLLILDFTPSLHLCRRTSWASAFDVPRDRFAAFSAPTCTVYYCTFRCPFLIPLYSSDLRICCRY